LRKPVVSVANIVEPPQAELDRAWQPEPPGCRPGATAQVADNRVLRALPVRGPARRPIGLPDGVSGTTALYPQPLRVLVSSCELFLYTHPVAACRRYMRRFPTQLPSSTTRRRARAGHDRFVARRRSGVTCPATRRRCTSARFFGLGEEGFACSVENPVLHVGWLAAEPGAPGKSQFSAIWGAASLCPSRLC